MMRFLVDKRSIRCILLTAFILVGLHCAIQKTDTLNAPAAVLLVKPGR